MHPPAAVPARSGEHAVRAWLGEEGYVTTMESEIESFFSGAFQDLERDGLGARYKRRGIADFLSSLVGSSSSEQERAAACRHAVQIACRIHARAVAENGEVCPLGKHHNVLYVALKLSFEWRLACGPTVAKLLEEIFRCEKTFERIVIAAILGPIVTRLLSGWQADFNDAEESLLALEYLLQHATQQGLRFYPPLSSPSQTPRPLMSAEEAVLAAPWPSAVDPCVAPGPVDCAKRQPSKDDGGGVSMVDVVMPSYHDALPTHLACLMARPAALQLLLRHGARVGQCAHGCWETEGPPPLAVLHLLARLGEAASLSGPGGLAWSGAEAGRACVTLLLRTVPHLPLIQDDRLRELAENADLPRNRWAEPPELRHLARCAVRSQLARAMTLPSGLRELPLPSVLVTYLDLGED